MAAKNKYEDMVVFMTPEGPVSNDRRFDLEEYKEYLKGLENPDDEPEDQTEDEPEDSDEGEDEGEDGDEDETSSPDYSKLKSAELKKLAADRDIDMSGITKKSELIQLLEASDASSAE